MRHFRFLHGGCWWHHSRTIINYLRYDDDDDYEPSKQVKWKLMAVLLLLGTYKKNYYYYYIIHEHMVGWLNASVCYYAERERFWCVTCCLLGQCYLPSHCEWTQVQVNKIASEINKKTVLWYFYKWPWIISI